ncbi:uncharacterized protein with PIN domain [Aminobacter aminovorans]|uniref:Ribonuclease VapC n=1 Tax=Aminobacter aminovorans TaxID=83263 RepID=A0AAC8YRX9_AMIAI|nr:Ribonuclease VapC [Aminobacter aminovorans]MBB3705354.1 uncharacterized protein with PIN domain [Aminobacter aminovorans]
MPLYIRDNEVDALAAELQAVSGAASKTEAVRTALLHEIARNRAKVPLRDRLAALQAKATAIGLAQQRLRHEGIQRRDVGRRMPFVDASVIVAILNQEAGWEELVKRLDDLVGERHVSPLVRFGAVVALARAAAEPTGRKPTTEVVERARDLVDDFILEIAAQDMAISGDVGSLAIAAGMRYG